MGEHIDLPLFFEKIQGLYTLWIEAEDNAGNRRTAEPIFANLASAKLNSVYLPLVLKEVSYH